MANKEQRLPEAWGRLPAGHRKMQPVREKERLPAGDSGLGWAPFLPERTVPAGDEGRVQQKPEQGVPLSGEHFPGLSWAGG